MRKIVSISLLCFLLSLCSLAQHSSHQLGKVDFKNSCKPEVQASLQRSVAMLHSFRYAETEKAFREVLAQDPSCGVATWGLAAILMSNPLTGIGPSPEWAARGKAAVEEGRSELKLNASVIT